MADQKVILIVDDEQDAIDFTSTILSDIDGVSIISANDGDAGLAKAASDKPDMIVLDVQMPGKSGFDVFGELVKNDATKDIPVVMLTGVAANSGLAFSADEMKGFLGKEPAAYIEKPVDPQALQKTASEILGL